MQYNVGDRFEQVSSGLMGQVVEVNDRTMTVDWEVMIVSQALENWDDLVYNGKAKYHPAVA
jgi:uncharacterized protein YkvS